MIFHRIGVRHCAAWVRNRAGYDRREDGGQPPARQTRHVVVSLTVLRSLPQGERSSRKKLAHFPTMLLILWKQIHKTFRTDLMLFFFRSSSKSGRFAQSQSNFRFAISCQQQAIASQPSHPETASQKGATIFHIADYIQAFSTIIVN